MFALKDLGNGRKHCEFAGSRTKLSLHEETKGSPSAVIRSRSVF